MIDLQLAPTMTDNQTTALGRFIRHMRNQRGMKQPELAKMLDLAQVVTISRWEQGKAPVSPRHYRGLALAFNMPVSEIIELASKDSPESVEEYHRLGKLLGKEVPEKPTARLGMWSLSNKLRNGIVALRNQYPRATDVDLLEAAVESYLQAAEERGLDGHFHPLPSTGPQPKGSQQPTSPPKKKQA